MEGVLLVRNGWPFEFVTLQQTKNFIWNIIYGATTKINLHERTKFPHSGYNKISLYTGK